MLNKYYVIFLHLIHLTTYPHRSDYLFFVTKIKREVVEIAQFHNLHKKFVLEKLYK